MIPASLPLRPRCALMTRKVAGMNLPIPAQWNRHRVGLRVLSPTQVRLFLHHLFRDPLLPQRRRRPEDGSRPHPRPCLCLLPCPPPLRGAPMSGAAGLALGPALALALALRRMTGAPAKTTRSGTTRARSPATGSIGTGRRRLRPRTGSGRSPAEARTRRTFALAENDLLLRKTLLLHKDRRAVPGVAQSLPRSLVNVLWKLRERCQTHRRFRSGAPF